ncbi:hypothetical protein AVEN_115511-1 [Araneus ventricosus]|uniref:Uncharacterized protein n=1 Tax=Araneus ventricosus TaxID=182803 RepID=A0A4Y2CJL4_ARAVE|nr:hypothetical protein AVEN_115511-1 [Araneus ventricosus]
MENCVNFFEMNIRMFDNSSVPNFLHQDFKLVTECVDMKKPHFQMCLKIFRKPIWQLKYRYKDDFDSLNYR